MIAVIIGLLGGCIGVIVLVTGLHKYSNWRYVASAFLTLGSLAYYMVSLVKYVDTLTNDYKGLYILTGLWIANIIIMIVMIITSYVKQRKHDK
jgi:hydrogenase maturation factor